MSSNISSTDRESRKRALEQAKERLNKRRREREQLKNLREQRKNGQTITPQIYGQTVIKDTKLLIESWKKEPEKKIDDEDNKNNVSLPNIPGKRVGLTESIGINSITIIKRNEETYTKSVQTNGIDIAQLGELIDDKTTEETIENIMKEFMSEDIKCWPPKEKKNIILLPSSNNNNNNNEREEKKDEFELTINEKEKTPELVLNEEAANKILSQKNFQEAFHMKTKWMERALGMNEKHSIFWELDEDVNNESRNIQLESLKFKQDFELKEISGRAVTCLETSLLNNDIFLSCHAKLETDSFSNNPDGCILIWNNLLPKKPEYKLESQSMINTAVFHPTNPKMILGATLSGQILGWDIRAKLTPSFRSRSGHYAPVYSLKFLPSAHRTMLPFLTVSNDANICMWNDDFLVEPKESLQMKLKEPRADEIATTCLSFPSKDSKTCILGSDEGCLYKVDIHSSSQNNELIASDKIEAHFGPITNVDFHPTPKGRKMPRNVEQLFLTSSYDWNVKLWFNDKNAPKCLATFKEMQDYVYDAQWSPIHPSVFACCDGTGRIGIFDLNESFEHPVSEPTLVTDKYSLTKLSWSKDGKSLYCSDSNGKVYLYEVNQNLSNATDDDFMTLGQKITRKI